MVGSDDTPDDHPTMVDKPGSSQRTDALRRSPDVTEVLRPGNTRLDRFSTLGKGGFASIEIAVDRVLQRRLAMKVIHRELQRDDLTVQLFAREAMITAQLDHPNIVPVHDVGCDVNDRLYFTMKLVEGRTLSQIIEAQPGPLDWDGLRNRLEIVIKLCDALSFAHSRGVLHCDVKSDNVMVGDFGQVYLMDWGIAKLTTTSTVRIEGPLQEAAGLEHLHLPQDDDVNTTVLGTPAYMSPEQALGARADLDERADVFSLGAVLYEIITGKPPHAADSGDIMLASARAGDVRPPSTRTTHPIPPEFERIVMKALAHNRDDRYGSIDALRDAVVAFARGDSGFPRVAYGANELIIREGDDGDAVYIIVSGQCDVYQTVDGTRRTLRRMGPGEVFGEAAVLSPGPRTASVVACEPTSLLVIDSEALHAEVGAIKPWLARVVRTLATRFREAESARLTAQSDRAVQRDSVE